MVGTNQNMATNLSGVRIAKMARTLPPKTISAYFLCGFISNALHRLSYICDEGKGEQDRAKAT